MSGAECEQMGRRLDELDLSLRLSKRDEAARLLAAQETRLAGCASRSAGRSAAALGPPLCVVFEGWDASGKGGAIKRLVEPLDPRHVRVAQFAAPTYDEKRHHFLWRFWPVLPGWGGMAVFDRSWYGRVLVERVEGFATERAVAPGLRRDRRLRADARRRGHDHGQVLDARLAGGAAAPLRAARGRPAEVVEAHRRGLAQPGEARASTTPRSRTCWPAPTTRRRRGTSSRATTSATPASRSSRRSCAAIEDGMRARGFEVPPPPAALEPKLHV